jgi:hypothetical protein
MATQPARAIYYQNTVDKDDLAVQYGSVKGTVFAKFISQQYKNTDYLGGEAIRGGTIKVRRFKSSAVQAYGTARSAAAGNKVVNYGVDVLIDTDKELAEELTGKDLALYNAGGLGDLFASRKSDYAIAIGEALETDYFLKLQTAAAVVDLSASTTIQAKVMQLIQYLESRTGNNVKKVDREDMVLMLSPEFYDNLAIYLLTLPNPREGGADIKTFMGVETVRAVRQGVDCTIQHRGSVAQPVVLGEARVEQLPLSDEKALYLPFYFGTKVVMPDLVFKAILGGADISA